MYKDTEVVRIAKRENNTKRKYLVINRLQGKHIPVSPHEALTMFDALGGVVESAYKGEKLLLIGFAETATAIGARIAVDLGTEYIQTTREMIEGVDYLYFTESHSHATEQKLVREDIDRVISHVQRIVFIEDEVTTGATILKIIDIIEKRYPGQVKFSVASILNGMDQEAFKTYSDRGINLHYLIKTDHSSYTNMAERYQGDGRYEIMLPSEANLLINTIRLLGHMDARRCVHGLEYSRACHSLWEQVREHISMDFTQTVLVIGTEEFMYPALSVAEEIEKMGKIVRFHATTRSPIAVSLEKEYPLHQRFELTSLYEESRKTYIYDLMKYDLVLIITDAKGDSLVGVKTLMQALHSVGNDKITVFRWCGS